VIHIPKKGEDGEGPRWTNRWILIRNEPMDFHYQITHLVK